MSLHQARLATATIFGVLLIAGGVAQNAQADRTQVTLETKTEAGSAPHRKGDLAQIMIKTKPDGGSAPNRSDRTNSNRQLQSALRHLRTAKAELQSAAPIYRGERAEAIRATDKAIEEVQEALKIR